MKCFTELNTMHSGLSSLHKMHRMCNKEMSRGVCNMSILICRQTNVLNIKMHVLSRPNPVTDDSGDNVVKITQ